MARFAHSFNQTYDSVFIYECFLSELVHNTHSRWSDFHQMYFSISVALAILKSIVMESHSHAESELDFENVGSQNPKSAADYSEVLSGFTAM